MIADWANQWLPDQPKPWSPWTVPIQPWYPGVPTPVTPVDPNVVPVTTTPVTPVAPPHKPWTREQLDQFEEILRLVREMEDKLGGCPCEEPSKLDYLKDIRARLDRANEQIEQETPDEPDAYVDG